MTSLPSCASSRRSWVASILSLVLPALSGCQSSIRIEDGSGGGVSTTGSATTSVADSSSSGLECPQFADAVSPGVTTVRIHNESFQTIYLPTTCSGVDLDIDPITGSAVDFWYDPSCLQTCADRQTQGHVDCGACPSRVHRLAQGEVLEIPWNETGLAANIMMPKSCYFGSSDPSCSQIVAAPSGEYRVNATAWSSCEGECSCDGAGECEGQPAGQQGYANPTTFDLSSGVVDVVFGVCSIPCPD